MSLANLFNIIVLIIVVLTYIIYRVLTYIMRPMNSCIKAYAMVFFGKHKYNIVPRWNDYCKHIYYISRDHFIDRNNRLGDELIFDIIKKARSDFRNALKFCKKISFKLGKINSLHCLI